MNEIKKIVKEVENLTAEKVAIAEREKALIERLEAAKQESIRVHDETKQLVDDACVGKYFCGVLLTDEDLINLMKVAISKPHGESIKIPYQLYPIEEIHETTDEDGTKNPHLKIVQPQNEE